MKIKLTFEIDVDGNELRKEIKGNYDTYEEYFSDYLDYTEDMFAEAMDNEIEIKKATGVKKK